MPSTPPPATCRRGSTAFAAFVDQFLDQFAKYHPSIAAGNGLHQADGTLEDFSATAIAAEIAMWRGLKTRLAAIAPDGSPPDERVDHRIVSGLIDAWMLELDTNRNWQKNLMLYASAISDGVHNLMTMESAPADVRARRVVSKLKGVPALLEAARVNIANPPRVMAERGVRMLKGASAMLSRRPGAGIRRGAGCAAQSRSEEAGERAARAIDTFSVASRRNGCRKRTGRSWWAPPTSRRGIRQRN